MYRVRQLLLSFAADFLQVLLSLLLLFESIVKTFVNAFVVIAANFIQMVTRSRLLPVNDAMRFLSLFILPSWSSVFLYRLFLLLSGLEMLYLRHGGFFYPGHFVFLFVRRRYKR